MLRFLIVDDSIISRTEMRKAINATHHMVFSEAQDAIEAIESYKKNIEDIDLITMDIDMPYVNGIVAVKKIIEINNNAKIIMVTSRGQEDLVKESIRAGAIGYILKPITKDGLTRAIDLIS